MSEQELEITSESDVSLDEEDEDLIGRVFYNNIPSGSGDLGDNNGSDEELRITDDDNTSISEISDTSFSDEEDIELVNRYKNLKKRKVDKQLGEEDRKKLMMASFSEDQMDRFEAYRRVTVNKPGVKKICNGVLGHSIPQNIAVVLAGLSKLFLSEIITKAFEIQEKENKANLIIAVDQKKHEKKKILKSLESGQDIPNKPPTKLVYGGDFQTPLKPEHVREAVRLYKYESSANLENEIKNQNDSRGKAYK